MTNEMNDVIVIDGGSKQYWADRKHAWALIRHLERCSEIARSAPMYIRGPWSDDYGDYEPVENLGPWDDLKDAQDAVLANPTAMRIMEAQGRDPRRL